MLIASIKILISILIKLLIYFNKNTDKNLKNTYKNLNKMFDKLFDKIDSYRLFVLAYSYDSRVIISLDNDCNGALNCHEKIKLYDQKIYIENYKKYIHLNFYLTSPIYNM